MFPLTVSNVNCSDDKAGYVDVGGKHVVANYGAMISVLRSHDMKGDVHSRIVWEAELIHVMVFWSDVHFELRSIVEHVLAVLSVVPRDLL